MLADDRELSREFPIDKVFQKSHLNSNTTLQRTVDNIKTAQAPAREGYTTPKQQRDYAKAEGHLSFPLVGVDAALASMAIMDRPAYWCKVGMTKFYYLHNFNGAWQLHDANTVNKDFAQHSAERSQSRAISLEPLHVDGKEGVELLYHLTRQQRNQEGGFFIPAATDAALPLATAITHSDHLGVEIDDVPTAEEQLARYEWFCGVSGLSFNLLVSSGSKSVHGHIFLDTPAEYERLERLRQLLIILLRGDLAVQNRHQPMRFPGLWRGKKRKHQSLLAANAHRYSLEEVETGIALAFEAMGWEFPDSLHPHLYQDLVRVVKNAPPAASGKVALADADRCIAIGELFAKGSAHYEKLEADRAAKLVERRLNFKQFGSSLNTNGGGDLFEVVKSLEQRLSPLDAFGSSSWDKESGGKAKGKCVFHGDANSTNSAFYNIENGTPVFFCPSCTKGKLWGPLAYWTKEALGLEGLEGKEWAEAAKKWLALHGVDYKDNFTPRRQKGAGGEKPAIALRPIAKKSPLTATSGFEMDYGYMPSYAMKVEIFKAFSKAKLIVIRANMSLGKTNLIKEYEQWLQAQSESDIPVYLFTSRNALGESLGAGMGLSVKAEITDENRALGGVYTLDSLHQKSATPFNGASISDEAIVIVDEADQALEHLVLANTHIAKVRCSVIENFCSAALNARQLIVMSAGVDDSHVKIIQMTTGITDEQTLSLVNTHVKEMGVINRCLTAEEAWGQLAKSLDKGERIISKLSGQNETSIFGTCTAEAYCKLKNKKALLLDSVTLKDPSNKNTFIEAKEIKISPDGESYEVTRVVPILVYINPIDGKEKIARQNEIFGQYDATFYTNALSSGMSIEADCFDTFVQIENGAGSIDDVFQSTGRPRKTDIKRFAFIKDCLQAPYGNGSPSAANIIKGETQAIQSLNKAQKSYGQSVNIVGIMGAKFEDLSTNADYCAPGNIGSYWVNYAAMLAAKRNAQASEYAHHAWALLAEGGYEIKDDWRESEAPKSFASVLDEIDAAIESGVELERNNDENKSIYDEMKQIRDDNKAAVYERRSLTDVEGKDLEKLEQKRLLTQDERDAIAKLRCMDRYGVEHYAVPPALLIAESEYLSSKLKLRVRLQDAATAAKVDTAQQVRMSAMAKNHFKHDLLRKSTGHKVLLLQQLGIDRLIARLVAGEHIHSHMDSVVEICENMIRDRGIMKQVLGVTGSSWDSDDKEFVIKRPIASIKAVLAKLGYGLENTKKKATVRRERTNLFALTDEANGLIDFERFKDLLSIKDAEFIEQNKPTGTSPALPKCPLNSKNDPDIKNTPKSIDMPSVEDCDLVSSNSPIDLKRGLEDTQTKGHQRKEQTGTGLVSLPGVEGLWQMIDREEDGLTIFCNEAGEHRLAMTDPAGALVPVTAEAPKADYSGLCEKYPEVSNDDWNADAWASHPAVTATP